MVDSVSLREMARTGLFEREIKVHHPDGGTAQFSTGDVAFKGRVVSWNPGAVGSPAMKPEVAREAVFAALRKDAKKDEAFVNIAISNFKNQFPADVSRPLTNRKVAQIFESFDFVMGNKLRLETALEKLPPEFKKMGNTLRSSVLKAISEHPEALTRGLSEKEIQGIATKIGAGLSAEMHSARSTMEALAHIRGSDSPENWVAEGERFIAKEDRATLRESFTLVTATLSDCYSLISAVPMSRNEARSHMESLQARNKTIETAFNSVRKFDLDGLGGDLAKAMLDDLVTMKESLESHIKQSEVYLAADPLSAAALASNDEIWIKAGEAVLKAAIEAPTTSAEKGTVLSGVLNGLRDEIAAKKKISESAKATGGAAAASVDPKKAGKEFKKLAKLVPTLVERALRNAGMDKVAAHKQLHGAHLEILNKTERWKPVERTFQTADRAGKLQEVKSKLTPASCMAAAKYFPVQYAKNTGVSCETIAEKNHTVNLAESELTFAGKQVFKGLRHGVHCAFGIKDPTERAVANLNRANESIIAALVQSGKMGAALKGEETVLALTSISLMTPDDIRGGVADEKMFVREQLALWGKLEKGDEQGYHKLLVRNEAGDLTTIKIKLDVAACNFGVNTGAVTGVGRHVSGWGNVKAANENAINKIVARAASYEGEHKEVVGQLSKQIQKMWKDGSYAKMGNEPYKMVARLAVISHLMDNTALWNCKSGKDRTGRLDAEIKFLMLQIEKTGKVPEPDAELNAEEQALMRDCVLKSGNLELQEINTGVAGYKAKGVAANELRSGDRNAETFGASAATSA